MTGTKDERVHPRIQAAFRVRSSALDTDAVPGDNVSRGGIFVRATRFLPLNAVIRLTIELPDGGTAVPATCRVAFVRDATQAASTGAPAGMGFEILDMTASDRAALEALLAARRSAQLTAEPLPPSQAPLRILVVDDDDRYRELAAQPFEKRGDGVRRAHDGLEALSLCLKETPDVILTDVQMPRMDGWQLLRLVRARPSLASVPVVFLTTLNGEAERLLGYQLGVDAYFSKPYDADELLVRVHQIVRRAQNARTNPAARTTLRGEIEHVGVPALLGFLEVERKTGVLLLVGPELIRLFFSGGRLLRAEIEGAAPPPPSRQVVFRALGFQSGQFEFSGAAVPGPDELSTSVTALLLDHARLSDEGGR